MDQLWVYHVLRHVSKVTLGKLLRDGVESIIMCFSECIDHILN